MNTYSKWLNLDFDPFAPGAKSRDFYHSGHRQQILDQIVELSLYSNAMIAVTGPLGSGKTALAANFRSRFADEAVCVKISATLFMNQSQFLESLQDALGFKSVDNSEIHSMVQRICQYAAELDLEARSLIVIVDDAHELSAEVLQLLTQILETSVDSSIHSLLLGESQLDSLLQSALSIEAQERLAVFPLYGFASEETHEYIRFKLATANYTKDLPINGGVVGAIHNSSSGMPGAINNLVAQALNSAAPLSVSGADSDIDSFVSGVRIGEYDEGDTYESMQGAARFDAEAEPSLPAWIASVQPRYWGAAATLVVLLMGTLLFWDTTPRDMPSEPIAVAVTPTTVDAIAVASEEVSSITDSAPALVDAGSVAIAEEEPPAEVVPEVEVLSTESVAAIDADVNADDTTAGSAPSAIEPLVESAEVAAPARQVAAVATASPFVELLLEASPDNYAVQLLASHSEESISKFVAQFSSERSAGYFETRYQGKPWFVAVLASFDDRARATQAISSLPATLRSNEPWIRSMAGIQDDIRGLLSSKLVSSK